MKSFVWYREREKTKEGRRIQNEKNCRLEDHRSSCVQRKNPYAPFFETGGGALRFDKTNGKKENEKSIVSFHSFFILWTRQCEKTQIFQTELFFFTIPWNR